jgi:NAD dependent epimerase/dehydratase family enzyme
VAVAGATGLVGTALVKHLLSSGYSVKVLTRNVVSARNKLPYPGLQFVAPAQWSQAVCGTAAVVNLAGTAYLVLSHVGWLTGMPGALTEVHSVEAVLLLLAANPE